MSISDLCSIVQLFTKSNDIFLHREHEHNWDKKRQTPMVYQEDKTQITFRNMNINSIFSQIHLYLKYHFFLLKPLFLYPLEIMSTLGFGLKALFEMRFCSLTSSSQVECAIPGKRRRKVRSSVGLVGVEGGRGEVVWWRLNSIFILRNA